MQRRWRKHLIGRHLLFRHLYRMYRSWNHAESSWEGKILSVCWTGMSSVSRVDQIDQGWAGTRVQDRAGMAPCGPWRWRMWSNLAEAGISCHWVSEIILQRKQGVKLQPPWILFCLKPFTKMNTHWKFSGNKHKMKGYRESQEANTVFIPIKYGNCRKGCSRE